MNAAAAVEAALAEALAEALELLRVVPFSRTTIPAIIQSTRCHILYYYSVCLLSFSVSMFSIFFENMILKTCHLFDRPGQDLRDQCGCRKKDQDDLRSIQPRERLEMRLGLSGGI